VTPLAANGAPFCLRLGMALECSACTINIIRTFTFVAWMACGTFPQSIASVRWTYVRCWFLRCILCIRACARLRARAWLCVRRAAHTAAAAARTRCCRAARLRPYSCLPPLCRIAFTHAYMPCPAMPCRTATMRTTCSRATWVWRLFVASSRTTHLYALRNWFERRVVAAKVPHGRRNSISLSSGRVSRSGGTMAGALAPTSGAAWR